MKLENIRRLAVVLALPFALLSCGDDRAEDDASGDKSGESAKKTHTQIGEEVAGVMDSLMTSWSEIKDVDSAKAYVSNVGEHGQVLKDLLVAAKELDPPTEEEKAAVRKLKDAADAKGKQLMGTMMQGLATNDDAEAIGGIIGNAMDNKDMLEAIEGLDALYDFMALGPPPAPAPAPAPAPVIDDPKE